MYTYRDMPNLIIVFHMIYISTPGCSKSLVGVYMLSLDIGCWYIRRILSETINTLSQFKSLHSKANIFIILKFQRISMLRMSVGILKHRNTEDGKKNVQKIDEDCRNICPFLQNWDVKLWNVGVRATIYISAI